MSSDGINEKKTLGMCFELNVCHNELNDNVYGQVYSLKYCLMLPE